MPTQIAESLIPIRDAAERIGVAYQTMRTWIAKGRIEYTRRGGRNFLSEEQLGKILVVVEPKGASHE